MRHLVTVKNIVEIILQLLRFGKLFQCRLTIERNSVIQFSGCDNGGQPSKEF